MDINDVAFSVDVDREVIDGVRSSELTRLAMSINEGNQAILLENIDGNLVLSVDEMPEKYHGCYLYNGGVFPYVIKKTLQFMVLSCGEDSCLAQIVKITTDDGTRFRFQGPGQPSIEDANGDSCLWHVIFEVKPVSKAYLLRWNPSISSFTEEDYEYCIEDSENGTFPLNWSIYEWEAACVGDTFYMMRVGDSKAGIVFKGRFTSNPYIGGGWSKSGKKCHYVNLICTPLAAPGQAPELSLEKLQAACPNIDWAKGHSGELLPIDVAEKLDIMTNAK